MATSSLADSDNSSVCETPDIDSDSASMDRFLERTKADLMYELRNIEHGHRPVTGQSHRECLQQFMEKHGVGVKDVSSTSGNPSGKESALANVDSVEIHRPQAVVVEVQAVVELRPVSSILQSAAFRRHLENVIRGSLAVNSTSASNNRSLNASPPSRPTSVGVRHTSTNIPAPGAIETLEVRPLLSRQISTESIDSFSSARSTYEQDIDTDTEEVEDTVVPPEEIADLTQPRNEGFSRIVDSQRQQRTFSEQPNLNLTDDNIAQNDITGRQREEIVEEISELLHSRLVSSTLGGEFRTVLELLAQNHLSSLGTNGRAVQDFINTLPRTGVQRNDFSHLGIGAVQENDNWDNISVTSVSAHSVPYAQTNSYLAREIQSLRSQMSEMKNMLRLTFDLQVDIQRAIRQEVSAVMNSVIAPGATGVSASAPRSAQPVSDSHCLICLDRHTDSVLYQCGHMCVCFVCGRDLVSRGHKCPVCRAPIKDVIRTYRTNAEQ